jgi:cytochrome c-type biogenesis protein CcsB
VLLNSCLVLYFLAALTGYAGVIAKKKLLERVALAFSSVGVILGLIFMIMRWVETGHPPMVRLFELVVLVSWMTMILAIVASTRFKMAWLHPGAAMVVTVCIASTAFMDDAAQPLVPALQSNWLTFHVITCFVSYSGFAIAFLIGIVYSGMRLATNVTDETTKVYETLMYKCVLFGMPLLTIGIVTGAVWANSAWGTYWSWDPKETWSLVTWLIYAMYLHLRKRPFWRGARAAMFNMLGFAAVLFTWFGVNYVLSGLHSYK